MAVASSSLTDTVVPSGTIKLPLQKWKNEVATRHGMLGRFVATPKDGEAFEIFKLCKDSVVIPAFISDILKNDLRITIKRDSPDYADPCSLLSPLKDFQKIAVNDSCERLYLEKGILLRADCGTGKTVMALAISQTLKVNSTLVLVDQINIAKQWAFRIAEFVKNPTVEIFGGGFKSLDLLKSSKAMYRIVVAQSLMRQEWADDQVACDLLIVDEAHVFSAPCFAGSVMNINYKLSIGLTATPDRRDKLEWVFQAFLGTSMVDVSAKMMTSKVIMYSLPYSPHIKSKEYTMFWCKQNSAMTWQVKCKDCPLYSSFPKCGGFRGYPAKPRVNHAALLSELIKDQEYTNWLLSVIKKLFEKKRQVMVFSHLRQHLIDLHAMMAALIGDDNCAIYIGTASKKERAKMETAMRKPITFCTYAIANKALDVPHKDALVFATPRSDIRQVKGRIERPLPNKSQPIIIDPVFNHIDILYYMSLARIKHYKKSGCEISSVTVQ